MYIEKVDRQRVPRHVAMIMDGNGRWAQAHGMERTMGHQAGAEAVRKAIETAIRLGVKYLTLYTFSTENWNRPASEVAALMALLMQNLEEELFMKNDVRFRMVGDIGRLPAEVQDCVRSMEEKTRGNEIITLVLALSYSSKWELTRAVADIAREVRDGTLRLEDICEDTVGQHLATRGIPDPELLIRTGGEERLSNFLLWQCAYSEFYFTKVFWPDFDEDEFCKAVCDYQGRQRRFGKTGEQVAREQARPSGA